jgi:hypothetical protein
MARESVQEFVLEKSAGSLIAPLSLAVSWLI